MNSYQYKIQNVLKANHADSLQAEAAGLNIRIVIPPRAPHFDGLWGSSIKSAKRHIIIELGNNFLSFEELTT